MLSLADITNEPFPSAIGKNAGTHLDGNVVAVFPEEPPFRHVDRAFEEQRLGVPQPRDIVSRKQVDDRLPEELLAGISEHAAAGVVDVDIATIEVGDEDAIGCLFDEIPDVRAARDELCVRAIEGHRSDNEHQQPACRQCCCQHCNRDRNVFDST